MSDTGLFDAPGPIAKRHILLGSLVALAGIVYLGWVVYQRLEVNGQFAKEKWEPLIREDKLLSFLLGGLKNTMIAAGIALAFALPLGIVLAIGRLSKHKWLRAICTAYVEVIRGTPVLLLMLFFFLAYPLLFGAAIPALWTVVLGLSLFNGAIMCEIVRAGVNALPNGQREAAEAIGMRRMHVMRLILLPQALRIMLPTLIGQFVVLIKDTSLGFILGYQELLSRSQAAGLLFNNTLQIFAVTAVVYIALNSTVSVISHQISNWQTHRSKTIPTESVDAANEALESVTVP